MNISPKRNTSIDLFRIVSMMMIIMLHLLANGQALWYAPYFSINYYVFWFIYIFVFCGVNCFALISGYVGYEARFHISKLFKLWIQVFFYGVVIVGAFKIFRSDIYQPVYLKKALLPITFKEYWYITAYFGMYLLSPLLNAAIRGLERKTAKLCLICLFVAFTLPTFLLYEDTFWLDDGFNMMWLSFLYLIGAYIKKYDVAKEVAKKKAWLIFGVPFLISFICKIGLEAVTMKKYGEAKFGYHFINYTTPFMVLQAIGLLLIFANKKVNNQIAVKVIGLVAPATLGIYLIHVNPIFFNSVINNLTLNIAKANVFYALIILVALHLAIFVSCTVIELVRVQLFNLIRIPKLCDFLGDGIQKKIEK